MPFENYFIYLFMKKKRTRKQVAQFNLLISWDYITNLIISLIVEIKIGLDMKWKGAFKFKSIMMMTMMMMMINSKNLFGFLKFLIYFSITIQMKKKERNNLYHTLICSCLK